MKSLKIIFETNIRKKKKYLAKIRKDKTDWKDEIQKAGILAITNIIIVLSTILTIITSPLNLTIILIVIITILTTMILMMLNIDIISKANYKATYPYNVQTNETLILTNDYLIYKFWKSYLNELNIIENEKEHNDEDAFVYVIKKSEIKRISINQYNICTITGDGILARPIWAINNKTKRISKQKDFSFVIAFNDENINNILKNYEKTQTK